LKWEPAPVDKYHRWSPVGAEERRQRSDIIGRLHVDLAYIAMLRATGGYTDFIERMAPQGYRYDVEVQPNDRRGGYDITYFKITPEPVVEVKPIPPVVTEIMSPRLDFWNDPKQVAEVMTGTDPEEWSRRGFYRIVNSFRRMS
jgi:hypothetical protein